MRSIIRAVCLFLAGYVLANPADTVKDAAQAILGRASNAVYSSTSTDSTQACLSAVDAEMVSKSFGLLISNYTTELAVRLLSDDFIDQADSVNTLINNSPLPHQPLGSLTFATKEEFLAGQGAQPPVPFDILNIWTTCDTAIIRWRSHQKPDPVQGVSIAIVEPVEDGAAENVGVGTDAKWQIKTIYAEFNSGAWLKNLGNPECPACECEGKKGRDWDKEGWEVDVEMEKEKEKESAKTEL